MHDGIKTRCLTDLANSHYFGAGEGNRTLVIGLEGRGSTTELHPHIFQLIVIISLLNFIWWREKDSNLRSR